MYLVDTNVISAAAPSRPASTALIEWMDTHSASLFMSAVTVAEIEDRIAKLRREGARRKSADLTAWLDTVLHLYGDRVLAFDAATARIAGAMSDRARGLGHTPGLADIIVAATARHRRLTILSRNVKHFGPLGVAIVDPFVKLPPM
jgi:toxin FitB